MTFPMFMLTKRAKGDREPAVATERQARNIKRVVAVITLLFCGLGAFFVVMGALEWMHAADSSAWPTVPASVTRSDVKKSTSTRKGRTTTRWSAHIEYTYTVAGVSHKGNKVTFRTVSEGEEDARATSAKFPLGSAPLVHVNPDDPTMAVLEAGADWSNAIPIAVGLVSIAFVVFLQWLVGRGLGFAVRRYRELEALGQLPKADEEPHPHAADQPDAMTTAETHRHDEPRGAPSELKPTFHDDLPGQR